jgi:hypothetical protein
VAEQHSHVAPRERAILHRSAEKPYCPLVGHERCPSLEVAPGIDISQDQPFRFYPNVRHREARF